MKIFFHTSAPNNRMQLDFGELGLASATDAKRYAISRFDKSTSIVTRMGKHHNQSSQQISFREEVCLKARD